MGDMSGALGNLLSGEALGDEISIGVFETVTDSAVDVTDNGDVVWVMVHA